MSQDDDLSQFFFVLPLKNIPNSNTKVEWVWVLSPTPLLNSLQINHFAANTCYQSLAFCLVGTQALAQLHNHTCLLRSLSVLACTRLYCHKLPTISIHLFFFFFFHFLLPCTKLGIIQGSIFNPQSLLLAIHEFPHHLTKLQTYK